jgi:hypothetical protein
MARSGDGDPRTPGRARDAPGHGARARRQLRGVRLLPVQGFGKVLDRELYFRARHDEWSFDVADEAGRFPSDGFRGPGTFFRAGPCPNASWMPHAEAVKIILRCLADYTGVTIHIGALPFPKSP